jgi:hypothetical protein
VRKTSGRSTTNATPTTKLADKKTTNAEDLSIPPIFSAAFYKAISVGAKKTKTTRSEFAWCAVQFYLEAMKTEKTRDTALAKALGSEELATRYREANSKISKSWWSKLSEEEKSERARKAVEARWGKKKQ